MKGPMWRYTFELGVQLKEALELSWEQQLNKGTRKIDNVVICGMGGSGIAASMVKDYIGGVVDVPIEIVNDYNVPAYVGMNTLVIVSSYSGNTEETLCCYDQAIDLQASVVCITSGGKLKEKADYQGIGVLKLPEGRPPRTCIGYSFVQVLVALEYYGVVDSVFRKEMDKLYTYLSLNQKLFDKAGQKIARKIHKKVPIIYSSSRFQALAVRMRQQLNENAKVVAFTGVVPEMNHNEIVGWRDIQHEKVVVFIRSKGDNPRVEKRLDITKKIVKKATANVIEVGVVGEMNYIQELFCLIMITDYVSLYLAEFRKVDPESIPVIDYLKKALGKL